MMDGDNVTLARKLNEGDGMDWLLGDGLIVIGIAAALIVVGVFVKHKKNTKDKQFSRDQYEGKK